MSFLQPLEQPPARQSAASAQDGEGDSDEGGEGGQGDPHLESSMYMINDSEPGLTHLHMLHLHNKEWNTAACSVSDLSLLLCDLSF